MRLQRANEARPPLSGPAARADGLTAIGPRRRRAATAGRWALTLGLLAVLAWQIDLREVGSLLAGVSWPLALVAALLVFVDRLAATLRWWLLLRAREVRIRFGPLLWLHLGACFMGSFLPTSFGVDAVRVIMLARRTGRTVECIAASLMDRLLMIVCTLLLAVPTGFVLAGMTGERALRWAALGAAALAAIGLGAIAAAAVLRPSARIGRWIFGPTLSERLAMIYWSIHEYRCCSMVMMTASLITLFMLILRLGIVLVMAWALGVPAAVLPVAAAMPTIWVLVMLPVSVGGFGVQELAYYAALGAAGIAGTAAVSISLLDHILVRLVALPGMLVWAGMTERRPAEPGVHSPGAARSSRSGGNDAGRGSGPRTRVGSPSHHAESGQLTPEKQGRLT